MYHLAHHRPLLKSNPNPDSDPDHNPNLNPNPNPNLNLNPNVECLKNNTCYMII